MTNPSGANTESADILVAGQKLKYSKTGSGDPSIVFLSGHRTPMSNWNDVVSRVSGIGTVLTYDRLDTGGSGRSSNPQDGNAILSAMNALLDAVDVNPPYILVAHSLGGLYANLYARRYPDKVGALVLVEAAHPSEAQEQPDENQSRSGILGKLFSVFTPAFKKDPNSEYNNVKASVQQIENAPEFPNKFVAVITGGSKMPLVPEKSFQSHLQWQKKLASISTKGYQIMAEKSGHTPQISEPDLVADAIAKAINSIKAN